MDNSKNDELHPETPVKAANISFSEWFNRWIRKRWYVALLIVFFTTATVQFLGDTFFPPFNSGSSVIGIILSWIIVYILYKVQNPE